MNKHIIAEILLGTGFVVLAVAAIADRFQHSIEIAKVEAKIEGRAEQQKADDTKLQELQNDRDRVISEKEKADALYAASQRKLQQMTSQQVVQQAPQFISGIPASSRPITIWSPGGAPPQSGDAVVPADQIKPIAEQILAGNHCIKDSLPSCVNLLNISNQESKLWNHKFDLKDMDSKDWEKVAKGGSFWRKAKRCAILGGVGGGIGYAPDSSNRGRNGLIGFGATAGVCMFLK